MKTLLKNEFIKYGKSVIFYIVLSFVIFMAFEAYSVPYHSFIESVKQAIEISKAKNIPLSSILSSQQYAMAEIGNLYAKNTVVNYMLSLFYPLESIFVPLIVSVSISNEFSWKTIMVLISHNARSKVFLSKYIVNVTISAFIAFLLVVSGFVFSSFFGLKVHAVLRQYAQHFVSTNLQFNFISNIPMQIVVTFIVILAITSICVLINILSKNAVIGFIVSVLYLYIEASLLRMLHIGAISIGINVFSVMSRIFYYFKIGIIQNFVSIGMYKGSSLTAGIIVILFYIILFTAFSYIVFKREDL